MYTDKKKMHGRSGLCLHNAFKLHRNKPGLKIHNWNTFMALRPKNKGACSRKWQACFTEAIIKWFLWTARLAISNTAMEEYKLKRRSYYLIQWTRPLTDIESEGVFRRAGCWEFRTWFRVQGLISHLSKDVDFQIKSTAKFWVHSVGTPALLLSSKPTSSPKSLDWLRLISTTFLRWYYFLECT